MLVNGNWMEYMTGFTPFILYTGYRNTVTAVCPYVAEMCAARRNSRVPICLACQGVFLPWHHFHRTRSLSTMPVIVIIFTPVMHDAVKSAHP